MIELLISSSLLIIIIALLRVVLKGRIRLRLQYGLWALVLLRLLMPVSLIQSSLSVMNTAGSLSPVEALQSIRGIDAIEYQNGEVVGYLSGDYMRDYPSVLAEDCAEADFSRMAAALELKNVLPYVWLGVAALFLLALVASNALFMRGLRRTRKLINSSPFADSPSLRACPLPVYTAERLPSPCLYGVLRPAIYLTPEALAGEESLSHIIAHELTHYRHGDNLWCALRALCLCVYWFNPFVWLAAALSKRDAELACDEGAIVRLGEEQRASYGRTLISLTCERARPADLLCAATTMTGGKRTIKERVTMIARKPKMLITTLFAAILIVAAAVGCTFTGSKSAESPAPAAEPDAETVLSSAAMSEDVIRSYPQSVQDAAEDYARLCFEADSGDFPEYKLTKYRISNLLPVYIYKTDSGDLSVYRMDFQYFSAESSKEQAVPYSSKLQDGWFYLNGPGSTYLIFDSEDKHLLTLSESDCQPGSPVFTNDMNLLLEQLGYDITAEIDPIEEICFKLGYTDLAEYASLGHDLMALIDEVREAIKAHEPSVEQMRLLLGEVNYLDGAYAEAYSSIVATLYINYSEPFAKVFNSSGVLL